MADDGGSSSGHKVPKIIIRGFDNWSNDHVIFRVPKMFRDLDEKAYTPRLVSIGPFHYGHHESCKGMQSHKEDYYLRKFLERPVVKSKKYFLDIIDENFETMIESKYAGAMEIDKDEFKKIILIDSCFIMELFLSYWKDGKNSQDYILRTSLIFEAIKVDLIMFENQIPFSFLRKLYKSGVACELNIPEDFLNLSIHFFFGDLKYSKPFLQDKVSSIKHFTDLYRRCSLPKKAFSDPEGEEKNETIYDENRPPDLCSATRLDEGGVDFLVNGDLKEVKVPSQGAWYSKVIPLLSSCKLELPELIIQDNTEYIFRNIIAMEQCQPDPLHRTPFCNYICLMDDLIDTEKDVDLLVRKKIITNKLGSNKVAAEMINKLCEHVTVATYMYSKEHNTVYNFYSQWYNHNKAAFMRVYFRDPWTGSSTVVGVIVVIFSIISSISSIWSLIDRKDWFGQ